MDKTKIITLRLTPNQEQILIAKARSAGFLQKSDYIRFVLFMSMTVEEKINKMYDKVCENG